ncbi:hypothetical protein RJ639_000452 [Escallonia herrerae]|uniref:Uncharacterized protein n=1 Tax=Escallonia herrerae TaxID=1293975 RepID=A0AA89BGI7_9ASTE|nr:hypothetical protein RJ639_000452 [Escallonia herrerae]
MDFLVKKMGRESEAIARRPTVLLYSLEKRIIPRNRVVRVLSLKGLLKKNASLLIVLAPVDKHLLAEFCEQLQGTGPSDSRGLSRKGPCGNCRRVISKVLDVIAGNTNDDK